MRNLMILLVVVVILFSAVPAIAGGWFSGPHDDCQRSGRHFHSVPWYSGDVSRGGNSSNPVSASAKTETSPATADNLAEQEAMRVFLDKGLVSASTEEKADFTVEIRAVVRECVKCYRVSSYSYSRRCYSDPERVVFITFKDKNDASVAIGKGDDKNFYNAVKDAAEDAANKIKEEKGKSVYIYDFS